jgi:hypothetical protein
MYMPNIAIALAGYSAVAALCLASPSVFSAIVYSNFRSGDSVSDLVYNLISPVSGGFELADPFVVPQGTDFALSTIEVPIDDALADTTGGRQRSRILLNLRADAAGRPGDILEMVAADVSFIGACFVSGTFNHACIQAIPASGKTVLHHGQAYWVSATTAGAGRVDWFVNLDVPGIASTSDTAPVPSSWFFSEGSAQGVVRLIGAPVPEPSVTWFLLIAAAYGWSRWCKERGGGSVNRCVKRSRRLPSSAAFS